MNPLAAAAAQLAQGQQKQALDAMIRAWRARPLPRLADAIDALDAQLGDFGPLFDGGNMKDKRARIEKLAKGKSDPRLARLLLEFIRDAPFSSTGAQPTYTAAFNALEKMEDPRVLLREKEVVEQVGNEKRRRLARLVADLSKRLPDGVPQPTPDEVTFLDKIEKRIAATAIPVEEKEPPHRASGKRTEELFAAVYAEPADVALRLVLADHLQQAGDPRGELIALQHAKKNPARVKELLQKHGKEWVGPLDRVLYAKGRIWKRGFLSAAQINYIRDEDLDFPE